MDDADPLIKRQLQQLGDLADIGLEVARAVGREAQADLRSSSPEGDSAKNMRSVDIDRLAMAYARVSRAVRLTIQLQTRLLDGDKARKADAAEWAVRTHPAYVRKAKVERIVESLAETEHPEDEAAVDLLVFEAAERLDDEALYGDLLDRPLGEIVERICKDLGLPLLSLARPLPLAGEGVPEGVERAYSCRSP